MRWRGVGLRDGGQNMSIALVSTFLFTPSKSAMFLKRLLSLFPLISHAGHTSAAPAPETDRAKALRHNKKMRVRRDSPHFSRDLMAADGLASKLGIVDSDPSKLQGASDIPLIGNMAQRAANRPKGIEQLAFHCGDVALQNAALAEVLRIDPKNALVHESVRAYIFEMGQHEFFARGWRKANRLILNPNDILRDLHVESDSRRLQLLKRAEMAPIQRKTVRHFFYRTVRYTWMSRTFDTLDSAAAAKRAECLRLARCVLGDRLEL